MHAIAQLETRSEEMKKRCPSCCDLAGKVMRINNEMSDRGGIWASSDSIWTLQTPNTIERKVLGALGFPTGQRPHLTGSGHAKPVLNEVKDQVKLGLWTCRGLSNIEIYYS